MATHSFRFEMDSGSEEPLTEIACPRCSEYLVVHMPDPDLPERLLGTCCECKSWYLMDAAEQTMTSIVVDDFRPPRAKVAARRRRTAQDVKRARIG